MAEYDKEDGVGGQVYAEAYCMKDSREARTNAEMNRMMGYNDLGDLSNTNKEDQKMHAAHSDVQLDNGLKLPQGTNRGM